MAKKCVSIVGGLQQQWLKTIWISALYNQLYPKKSLYVLIVSKDKRRMYFYCKHWILLALQKLNWDAEENEIWTLLTTCIAKFHWREPLSEVGATNSRDPRAVSVSDFSSECYTANSHRERVKHESRFRIWNCVVFCAQKTLEIHFCLININSTQFLLSIPSILVFWNS